MRNCLIVFLFNFLAVAAAAQSDSTQTIDTVNNAKVYVIRSTGHVGSAVKLRVLVDSIVYCKIKNNRYSVIYVSPGAHDFYATSWDAPRTKEKLALKLPLEAGKTYYLTIRMKQRFFENEIYVEEITANTAMPLLAKYEKVDNCE